MNLVGIFRGTTSSNKMDEQVLELYNVLEESKFSVAITGAGISIAAGGVTFNGMMRNCPSHVTTSLTCGFAISFSKIKDA